MGDCRIRIQIARELIDPERSLSNERDTWYTISKVCSADTTIREVVEEITVDSLSFALLPLLKDTQACLWDCTCHPPVDISEWPVSIYADKGGPSSKTLFDAKWYPSGSLQVVPAGQGPRTASSEQYDDSQYSLPSESIQPATQQQARVQLISTTTTNATASQGLPAPSQVLQAITKRFDHEAATEGTDQATIQIRRQNQQAVAARQAERFLKLDQRIGQLQEASGGKNKKVSDQVRRMLIKSRATGRSDLKMQDRVFLHCMIDKGEVTMREDYRYFSLQDTVGRVLSTFAETGKDAEVLIRSKATSNNADESPVYRRLPVLMRLYEVISRHYLADIDTVVIRLYNSAQEEATTSVDEDKDEADQPDAMDSETTANRAAEPIQKSDAAAEVSPMETADDTNGVINSSLADATRTMDESTAPKKKKKASAAAAKVRHMQMKSRATGDAKRVKMEERFFVELVTVTDDTTCGQCTATSAPFFVSQKDSFERLVRDCGKAPTNNSWQWELLVPLRDDAESASYRRISNTQMSFQEAQQSKTLNPFDRLILRYFLP
jgi:hypothetical protein